MKLLFIVKSIQKGGLNTVLRNRLNDLIINTDFEIHILSESENDSNLVKKFNSKITFHTLDIEKELSKKRFPFIGLKSLIKELTVKYKSFIDELNPDIITDFDWGYYTEIIPFIKTTSVRIKELHTGYLSTKLLHYRKLPVFFKKNKFDLHNKYEYVITLTKEDLFDRNYLKVKKKYIYNPILLNQEISDFQSRSNIILAVGTLTSNKNFKDLIESINLIKLRLNGWEVHIYGEGIELNLLQELIIKYSLNDIIKLKGFGNSMAEVYNDSKLLISTSLSEGFGMTLLEALSYKIPVISYNCKCGPKEIIEDNENGYLVELNNINDLSKKILNLIENKSKLNDFSKNTLSSIRRFDSKLINKEWINLYNGIINEN